MNRMRYLSCLHGSISVAKVLAMWAMSIVSVLPAVAQEQFKSGKPDKSQAATAKEEKTAHSEAELLSMLANQDPQVRQFAVVQLAELEKPSQSALNAIAKALADSDENVRFQALASCMRLGQVATPVLLKALPDTARIAKFVYDSEALNGMRSIKVNPSDLAFAALFYAASTDTDALLLGHKNAPQFVKERILDVLNSVSGKPTPALYDALKGNDVPLAVAAAGLIERAGADATAAVPILAEVITSGHDQVREATALALAQIPGRGVDTLRVLLRISDARTRRFALAAYPLREDSAAQIISKALKDNDLHVKRVGLTRIVEPLQDRYWWFYDSAAESPCETVTKAKSALKCYQELPETMVPEVLSLSENKDFEIRKAALAALVPLACLHPAYAPAIADALLTRLSDPVDDVKSLAADGLAMLARSDVVPRLENAVDLIIAGFKNQKDDDGSAQLLSVLARMKLPETPRKDLIEVLVNAGFESTSVSEENLKVILDGKPSWRDEAVSTLMARYHAQKKFDYSAWEALNTLGAGGPAYVSTLEQLLAHPEQWVRTRAALRLAELNIHAEPVLNQLEEAARSYNGYGGWEGDAARVLAGMIPQGTDRIIAIVKSPETNKTTRKALLYYTLGRVADKYKPAGDMMLSAAGDATDPDLQESMVWALQSVDTRPVEVKAVLMNAFSAKDAKVRRSVAMVWAESNLPADDLLDRVAKDPVASVRKTVFELLPLLPASDARRIAVTKSGIEDGDDEVIAAGLEFAGQLGPAGEALLADYAAKGKPLTRRFFYGVKRLDSPGKPLVAALQLRKQDALPDVRTQIDKVLARAGSDTPVDREKLYAQLRSPDSEARYSAAKALLALHEDPWARDGIIASVIMDAEVRRIIKERLGIALDRLYPPGFTQMSGRFEDLPTFPWPPPPGYQRVVIPRQILGLGNAPTLGDVYKALVGALETSSEGFEHGLFRGVPEGFALVARMERIEPDGTPLQEPGRWMKEGTPNLSLLSFLGDLFFEKPGYFRVIVFAATDNLAPKSDSRARLPAPTEGAADIPAELAAKPFTNQEVLALIYCFERRKNARIQPWQDGALSAKQHLEKAGIWASRSGR